MEIPTLSKYSLSFAFLCLLFLVFGLWNVKTEETYAPKPLHVLCYHDITPNSSFKYSRTTEKLKYDFQLLRDSGFKVVPLEKIIEAGQKKVPLALREAALTFDDATTGQYQYARPLLKSFGYPATFYAPTALVESGEPAAKEYSGTMAWADIQKLAEEGFYIASHGHSHKDLSRLSPGDLKEEIQKSLSLLRKRTGMNVLDFCLPYGLYKREQEEHFLEAGIRSMALTTTDHGPGIPALVKIRRFEVLADTGAEEILEALGWENKEKRP
ncbi:MAG: polysaccharide deacetylase family protein [Nitrospinae bacterium]|nr:polysaccharide deacetylase family protein [Nitrospinota bacterium]